jgi:hypothetical protein
MDSTTPQYPLSANLPRLRAVPVGRRAYYYVHQDKRGLLTLKSCLLYWENSAAWEPALKQLAAVARQSGFHCWLDSVPGERFMATSGRHLLLADGAFFHHYPSTSLLTGV